jgi:hypothetical protein
MPNCAGASAANTLKGHAPGCSAIHRWNEARDWVRPRTDRGPVGAYGLLGATGRRPQAKTPERDAPWAFRAPGCRAPAENLTPGTNMDTNYVTRDNFGMYANSASGPGPALMGADTLLGNDVYNKDGEDLGDIKEFMIDMASGKVAYAVLSFGGLLGMGDKLFAVPWAALALDTANKRFTLNVLKDALKNAPGFDKDHWPSMSDRTWASGVHKFYGTPYAAE